MLTPPICLFDDTIDTMNDTILVCEDNEGITDVVKIVLESKGYNVVAISSGEKIIEIIEVEKPALILMDLWLPGMNGDEIALMLKANSKTKHIPIIIVSASRDAEAVAKEIRADGALKKPFDIADLEAIVQKHINS